MDKPLGTIRWLLTAIVLLAVALYAVSALPLGGNGDSLAVYLRTIQERKHLEDDEGLLIRSIEERQDITARLIDGRLTLAEASAALREEIESRPKHLCPPLYNFPPVSEEEAYMRLTLLKVDNELEGDPRRDEVLKRLRAEYQAYRDSAVPSAPARGPTSPTESAPR